MRPGLARQVLRVRSTRLLIASRRLISEVPPLSQLELPPQPFPLYSPTADEFHNRPPRQDTSQAREKQRLSPEEQSAADRAEAESSRHAARRSKREMTARFEEMAPELTEEELKRFYQDLVKSGQDELQIQDEKLALEAPQEGADEVFTIGPGKGKEPAIEAPLNSRKRARIIAAMSARLGIGPVPAIAIENNAAPPDALTSTEAAATAVSILPLADAPRPMEAPAERQRYLQHLASIVPVSSSEVTDPTHVALPLGLVSRGEWIAIVDELLSWNDIPAAVSLLPIMRAHGLRPSTQIISRILETAASRDSPAKLVALMSQLATTPTTGKISLAAHRHVIPFLLARDPQLGLDYLGVFENKGEPAVQTVYQYVLRGLLVKSKGRRPSSRTIALGFDLFAHMRLVAHPQPSKEVYATMIQGCANSDNPQPERARDLWTEMTTEGRQYLPTRAEYDALIAALSSAKDTYLDAFEVYRTMIAQHEDATRIPFEDSSVDRRSPYMPTLSTWKALMSGAKRAGDLDRGRWLLGQMMRSLELASDEKALQDVMPDAESMANLFYTYATWKPPKAAVPVRSARNTARAAKGYAIDSVKHAALATSSSGDPAAAEERYGPRTSAEALAEATAIFERIVAESPTSVGLAADSRTVGPFSQCQLTSMLINAYLSVVLAHSASLQATRDGWESTWRKISEVVHDRRGQPNGWSYALVLEKCAAGIRGGVKPQDRELAVEWGRSVWARYQAWSAGSQTDTRTGDALAVSDLKGLSPGAAKAHADTQYRLGLHPRTVERAWSAAIRLHAKNLLLTAAIKLVSDFRAKFPPSDISDKYAPWLPNLTLVPATDPTLIAESNVPPHLLFKDVEVLHQELALSGMTKQLAWLKFTVKQYEGALWEMRKRRLKELGSTAPPTKHGMLGDFSLSDDERRTAWRSMSSGGGASAATKLIAARAV